MMVKAARACLLLVTLAGLLAAAPDAQAAPLNIVALGASNTYGRGESQGSHPGGVPMSQAFPAQLQRLLRARGIDAHVTNAGIPGNTTSEMLARLNRAVPKGTQIVILQTGGNDADKGIGASKTIANIAEITSKLQARGIRMILLDRPSAYAPSGTHEPDGQHYNAEGHAAIAAGLLPLVLAAMGQ
jgi:acyl-CoA thioesterase I